MTTGPAPAELAAALPVTRGMPAGMRGWRASLRRELDSRRQAKPSTNWLR